MISTAALTRHIFSLLAGLFLLSTVYFFAQNTSLHKQNHALSVELQRYKENVDKTVAQNAPVIDAGLKQELEGLKNQMQSVVEEKSYLEEILINKTKQIETLEKQLSGRPVAAASPALTGGSPDLSARLDVKDEEIRRLTERNMILSKKIQRLYKMTSERMSEINVAKMTLESTIASARKQIENEWNTVDLGSSIAEPGSAAALKPGAGSPGRPARNAGRVLAVNEEHGFVVVDLGKVDGIDDTTLFSLNKNGSPSGTLKVIEIRDVMTACNIKDLVKGTRIEVNDLVSIRK